MSKELLKSAYDAHVAMREWMQSVPRNVVLPTMPGIDVDWLDEVEYQLKKEIDATTSVTPDWILHHVFLETAKHCGQRVAFFEGVQAARKYDHMSKEQRRIELSLD